MQKILFFILLLLVSLAFLWIVSPYLQPVFWAATIAILFYPLTNYFNKIYKGNKTLSSVTVMAIITLAVFVPLSVLGAVFVNEVKSLYNLSVNSYQNGSFELSKIEQNLNALVGSKLNLVEMQNKFIEELKKSAGSISSFAFGVGKTSIDFLIKSAVMFYILFFFLRDGKEWVEKISFALPLGASKERFLFDRFTKIIRAVFKGSFVVALAQGAIGAIILWIAGVPSPVVWGALMAIASFIPAVGPAIVWGPIALVLFMLGDIKDALFIVLGGVFVLGLVDNILRPFLVGKNVDMPDLLVFISILGGISLFGVAGIIIGPVVTALFLAVWELFTREYKKELEQMG